MSTVVASPPTLPEYCVYKPARKGAFERPSSNRVTIGETGNQPGTYTFVECSAWQVTPDPLKLHNEFVATTVQVHNLALRALAQHTHRTDLDITQIRFVSKDGAPFEVLETGEAAINAAGIVLADASITVCQKVCSTLADLLEAWRDLIVLQLPPPVIPQPSAPAPSPGPGSSGPSTPRPQDVIDNTVAYQAIDQAIADERASAPWLAAWIDRGRAQTSAGSLITFDSNVLDEIATSHTQEARKLRKWLRRVLQRMQQIPQLEGNSIHLAFQEQKPPAWREWIARHYGRYVIGYDQAAFEQHVFLCHLLFEKINRPSDAHFTTVILRLF
ncbi:MAG: hypothetical protein RL235_600 [Chlamydiota bacterium]|jgi:hypothetical protein